VAEHYLRMLFWLVLGLLVEPLRQTKQSPAKRTFPLGLFEALAGSGVTMFDLE